MAQTKLSFKKKNLKMLQEVRKRRLSSKTTWERVSNKTLYLGNNILQSLELEITSWQIELFNMFINNVRKDSGP